MRLKYVLGLACGLGLTGLVSAQTTPAPAPPQTPAQTGQAQPGRVNPTPAAAPAQAPTGTAPAAQTDPYPTSLYRMNDVSKSLNLTPDQVNSLNKVTEQTQAQYRANYAKLNDLSAAERAARLRDLNQQYNAAWNKAANDVLNENQRTRYQQVYYQYGGFSAFNDPAVQQRLNLTVQQENALRAQEDWSNRQMQDINQIAATNPAKAAQMYRDYWTQRQERLDKFLTADQQKEWRQLTGEPYTFQPAFTPSR